MMEESESSNKNSFMYAIIAIVVVVAAFFVLTNWDKISTHETALTTSDEFMQVEAFDANGNVIDLGTAKAMTIVNGVPGVASLRISLKATNTGTIPLSCNIVDPVSGTLNAYLTRSEKQLPAGGKAVWTSSAISVAGMTGTQVFSATMRCSYNSGSTQVFLTDKVGTLSLTMAADGTASFDVGVVSGGTPTQYCGDKNYGGGCQAELGENAITCPADCASYLNAKYRTSDLMYPTGSAIAYGVCGSTLTQYGYTGFATCNANTSAASTCPAYAGYTLKLSGLKGAPVWGTGTGCLYQGTDTTQLVAAWKTNAANVGGCTTSGYWGGVVYDSDDPDKTDVSAEAQSFDIDKELTC